MNNDSVSQINITKLQRVIHFFMLICPLSLISFTGCDSTIEPWVTPDDVLVPLEVGNWWEYQISGLNGSHLYREKVFETLVVPTPGGSTIASAIAVDNGQEPPHKWLRANGPLGYYILGGVAPSDTLFSASVVYAYPAKVGDRWKAKQLSFSRTTLKFYQSNILDITLVDNERVVVTPAGTFVCYVYRYVLDAGDDVVLDFVYYTYYSPTVGLIKQEERRENESILNEMVLVRYNINGQNDHD